MKTKIQLGAVVGALAVAAFDDRDYQVPFRFTGKLHRLTVQEHSISGMIAQILRFKWATRD